MGWAEYLRYAARVSRTHPEVANGWQIEHLRRQTVIMNGLAQGIITDSCAELLDSYDNMIRQSWVKLEPMPIISVN